MKNTVEFSDEELTAYLDNELDALSVKKIDASLESDPALRQRLEHLSIDVTELSESFECVLSDAPAFEFDHSVEASSRQLPVPFLFSTALSVLIFGLCIGWGLSSYLNTSSKKWTDYVAAYHALYTPSTLTLSERSVSERQSELDRVSSAIGMEIPLDDVNEYPQLEYKRAQILGFENQPLVQLTFMSVLGDPVALCIIRSSRNSAPGLYTREMEGMVSVTWQKGDYEYFLIGGENQVFLTDLAAKFAYVL